MTLSTRDRQWVWHPFTQEKTAPMPIAIQRGHGAYLYDEDGRAYLDLISSWWVNLHGHANARIADRISEQAKTLEHVIFAGFTHAPAVVLCEALSAMLPSTLTRFFFSDNGSTSVEVALKMSYQAHRNNGQSHRTLFLAFEGGYHGDTFGAMAVGACSGFHDAFRDLFFGVRHIPFARYEEDEETALSALDRVLADEGDRIAALILEPLVQGASGMHMCRPDFVRAVVARVRAQGIFVIFDEVMTGFGRTGSLFALEQVDVVPDVLCLSKGLTGGFLPLALTVTTDSIYDAFWGDTMDRAFTHGHSYTANPLACAAALASLEILQEPATWHAIRAIHDTHHRGIQTLCELPCVQNPRILGTIAAFDVVSERPDLNTYLKARFLERGLLLRPLGNTVYMMPPYVTTAEDLEKSYEGIRAVISFS